MDELGDAFDSYWPTPQQLPVVGRVPAVREESLKAPDHAERALRAFAAVVAERGYWEATVDGVVSRAGMSASTFYASFRGKEDARMAAIESAGRQLAAAVHAAVRQSPG